MSFLFSSTQETPYDEELDNPGGKGMIILLIMAAVWVTLCGNVESNIQCIWTCEAVMIKKIMLSFKGPLSLSYV